MSSLRRVLKLITFCHFAAEAYQYNKLSSASDTIIQSPNYPSHYSPDLNVTWELDVPSGKWGVVFKDFDLDAGSGSYESRDRLEITDSGGKHVTYTAHIPPLMSYISDRPHLMLHFVSDNLSDTNRRGFRLHILYGANEREVQMKIHETTKTEKSSQDEKSGLPFIITAAVLTLLALAFVVIAVAVVLVRRIAREKKNDNRDAFGVRRNSGISHSRRTRSTDEAPPNEEPPQQPRRPERSVQRSNSQLNWMARAELTSTMQKTASSRPNAYTSTDVVKAAQATTHTTASSSRVTSTNDNRTRSCDSGLNEYSETVDCLNHAPGTSEWRQEEDYDIHQPPSYEESSLIPETQTNEKHQLGLVHCYENCASNVCTARQHQGNETNIYINTGRNSESRGSINEITIGANNCIIKATRGDAPEDNSSISKSAINLDAPATNIVIYQNVSANKQSEISPPFSSSSIQIIDGYAFIVPSSDYVSSYNCAPQLPIADNGRETQPLGNSIQAHNSAARNVEGAQNPDGCNDIYINAPDA